jgi:hypothetical protein
MLGLGGNGHSRCAFQDAPGNPGEGGPCEYVSKMKNGLAGAAPWQWQLLPVYFTFFVDIIIMIFQNNKDISQRSLYYKTKSRMACATCTDTQVKPKGLEQGTETHRPASDSLMAETVG